MTYEIVNTEEPGPKKGSFLTSTVLTLKSSDGKFIKIAIPEDYEWLSSHDEEENCSTYGLNLVYEGHYS